MSTPSFRIFPCYADAVENKKMGRPREATAKRWAILVKMTAEEKETIRQRARESKLPVATHMREAAMRRVG